MLFVPQDKVDSMKDPFEMSLQPFPYSKVMDVCLSSAFFFFTRVLVRSKGDEIIKGK